MPSHCLEIVKKNDPDRFLLSLFAPKAAQEGLWALFAFNYEVAKTRGVVSETTIGLIRLQWWREAIAEIYEGRPVREHEVLEALAPVIREHDLPRELFDHLVYAREFDLEDRAPDNMDGFLNYCDFTSTPLMKLATLICGESVHESEVKRIAIRYARIGILRAVPFMRNERRVMLPRDILDKHGLSPQKMLDFKEKEKLSEVVREVLDGINQFRNDMTHAKSRFLKVVDKMAALYEAQVESVGYDVYESALAQPPRFMALRLWVSSF